MCRAAGSLCIQEGSPLCPDQSRLDRSWASPPHHPPSFTQNETFVILISRAGFQFNFTWAWSASLVCGHPWGRPSSFRLWFSRSCCRRPVLTPSGAASQTLRPVTRPGSGAACPQPGQSPASVLRATWSGLCPTLCSLLVLRESGAGSSGWRRPVRRQRCSQVN